MTLPQEISACVSQLEAAGFSCYAVGGCVRDFLLGLTPQDYDLCTAAKAEQIKAVFADNRLILAGEKHGTVGVLTDRGVVEITTFRTEGGYLDNRHPDWVEFVTDIRQDLARRDFTVNAMAWSPTRGLQDPFGGQADLESKCLRCVGDPETRFREDSLRILRGLRFAVRFSLHIEPATWQAMVTLAPLLQNLAKERIFDELCKLLPLVDAEALLKFAPVFAQLIPELGQTQGFDQRSPHHAYDIYTHTAHVVAGVPREPVLRWAALLHDIGKVPAFTTDETGRGHFYGHAQHSARMADAILRRFKAPTAFREQVVSLIDLHMTKIPPERKPLRRWLSRLGPETLEQFLMLQYADASGKGIPKDAELAQCTALRQTFDAVLAENNCLSVKDLAVNGCDLQALGLSGPELGRALNRLLELVLEETVPNERNALLHAVKNEE